MDKISKAEHEKRIRIHADKLNKAIGMKPGEYISKIDIERLSNGIINEIIKINNTEVLISMSIKGLAKILLESGKIK